MLQNQIDLSAELGELRRLLKTYGALRTSVIARRVQISLLTYLLTVIKESKLLKRRAQAVAMRLKLQKMPS